MNDFEWVMANFGGINPHKCKVIVWKTKKMTRLNDRNQEDYGLQVVEMNQLCEMIVV